MKIFKGLKIEKVVLPLPEEEKILSRYAVRSWF